MSDSSTIKIINSYGYYKRIKHKKRLLIICIFSICFIPLYAIVKHYREKAIIKNGDVVEVTVVDKKLLPGRDHPSFLIYYSCTIDGEKHEFVDYSKRRDWENAIIGGRYTLFYKSKGKKKASYSILPIITEKPLNFSELMNQ